MVSSERVVKDVAAVRSKARSSKYSTSLTRIGQRNFKDEGTSPAEYLRSLVKRSGCSSTDLKRSLSNPAFNKPSESAISAYDMEAVRAVRSKDLRKLRDLLRAGKCFDACNRFGESIVHLACRRGDLNVVSFLAHEAKVNFDVRDDYGRTPLHDACWQSTPNFKLMEFLISHVSPDKLLMEDIRGHTPFDYARREHWEKWRNFLERHEATVSNRLQLQFPSGLISRDSNFDSHSPSQGGSP